MPNIIRNDLVRLDNTSFPYVFEQNVTVPLQSSKGIVRCNVYRPKDSVGQWPVLVTYGPYGKDIPYEDFHPQSFSEVPEAHQSHHSAWETPDPGFWTAHGYVVVRADEVGIGQSPGRLDTMSRNTSDAFCDVVEWAAKQPWSTGKVGLLGISYYAGSQWRVAARQPKGLCCMVPWEGMSDYYRDRCRHGGILSNKFIRFWWDRQVASNQYGKAGKAARNWGPDTIEGDLSEEELVNNRSDQNDENRDNHYRDDLYYASKEYNMADIQVPLLSVGNWGGILLHLRGNVEGWTHAGSRLKYLRFISGRHDLPFYYKEEVEVQKSFLDAFLKGEDRSGWSDGTAPKVDLLLRKGDVGFNNPEGEKKFQRRIENEWPIARTQYTRYFLTPDNSLVTTEPLVQGATKMQYEALGNMDDPRFLQFVTVPFTQETEVTGHISAHLNVSMSPYPGRSLPRDIDVFLTLRHLGANGQEILYTGTAGDGVPLCKGWLRVSLRKTNPAHDKHRHYLPYRDYFSTDVLPVIPGEVYPVDVEIWPTNVVLEKGERLVFEVASGDTRGKLLKRSIGFEYRWLTNAGCGNFQHNCSVDRSEEKLAGWNFVHFGPKMLNYVTLPIIPPKQTT